MSAIIASSSAASALNNAGDVRVTQAAGLAAAGSHSELHRKLGEFVGGVFFAPVLQEMQKSPFKTKYGDGGRGEQAFSGQLALELSKRAGRAAADGFARKWIGNVEQHVARTQAVKS